MRTRVSVVIRRRNRVLFIHRWNKATAEGEYYVLPGGGVKPGETLDQAATRDTREETNLQVELGGVIAEFTLSDDGYGQKQQNIIYLARDKGGMVALGSGGPESELANRENRYVLEWVALEDIADTPIVPAEAKKLLEELK